MHWEWDEDKNEANQRKHNLSFETAVQIFHDPLAATREDPLSYEQRWQTMGMVGSVVLIVVHTSPDADLESSEAVGRIISARKATRREREAYEEGEF